MPNILDATGLTLASRSEWVIFFTTKYQEIYGADINLASDTPDGQMMNINIQVILDLQDLVASVYNSFDPDNAVGNVLDQRVTINGIQRQAGTFTITPITLVNSTSVNLYGLDGVSASNLAVNTLVREDGNELYVISDNVGNLWYLIDTELGLAAGTHVLSFRAGDPGAQLTIPNTINVPVAIVLGVTSVNNPTAYSSLGVNEESDAQLRVRRAKSVSLASQGYLPALLAALENINGVTSAFVYENTTGATDSDGVPGHTIWVIVAGTAADADIANAIYTKRNAGAGMFGEETYTITQVDGSPFVIYWDVVVTRNLFIAFTATSIDGVTPPNIEAIRDGIPLAYIPGAYQEVNINQLATYVQEIDPNTLVTLAGFSAAETQIITLSGVPASGAFVVSYNGDTSVSIAWNASIGTIQSAVQAIDGLTDALVTGSLASQTLTFDLSAVDGVLALVYLTSNTLATSAPVAITPAYNEGYSNTLLPPTKKNQFIVSSEDIIILPMLLSPSQATVAATNSQTFIALGGYADPVFSLSVNNSGGSINASTGLYTAGAVTGVLDTVKATDAFGNFVTALVTVP